jgi:hypothetical protein
MGIDISCTKCNFQDKQCYIYKRELLDALREYLKKNKNQHPLELKYINYFYRYEKDDKERILHMEYKEKKEAIKLLQENELDGLFVWINLGQEDYISVYDARRFLRAYDKVKEFMKDGFMDYCILEHAEENNHPLQCW